MVITFLREIYCCLFKYLKSELERKNANAFSYLQTLYSDKTRKLATIETLLFGLSFLKFELTYLIKIVNYSSGKLLNKPKTLRRLKK